MTSRIDASDNISILSISTMDIYIYISIYAPFLNWNKDVYMCVVMYRITPVNFFKCIVVILIFDDAIISSFKQDYFILSGIHQ